MASDTLEIMAVLTEPLAVELLEGALPDNMHLRPLWERLVVADLPDCVAIGLPIANKVTRDTTENHRRHLFSLFNLLEVPLVASPAHLQQISVSTDSLRDMVWPDPKADKKKAAEEEE